MLPRICCIYFSNPFFISPRSTITSGIVVAFIPHILSISISRSLYFDSFSFTLTELLILFRGDGTSISSQRFSSLFLITRSGLLAFFSRSVCICKSDHKIVMLSFSVTVWGSSYWYHFSIVFIFISLQVFIFCLRKLGATTQNMLHRFIVATTHSASG